MKSNILPKVTIIYDSIFLIKSCVSFSCNNHETTHFDQVYKVIQPLDLLDKRN